MIHSHARTALPIVVAFAALVSCGGSNVVKTIAALQAKTPDELAKVLVDEEGKLVDVCSTFESTGAPQTSAKITKLLADERAANLGAVLDALRGRAASSMPNPCRTGTDVAGCAREIKAAHDAAIKAGGDLARVAEGLDAAFGKLSALTDERAKGLAARIRFSMLAVDGYVRLADGLEREVDEFVASLDIPIPLVSSIARGVVREASAELVAAGTDNVVHLLEQHSLVHRPSMIRQACERYLSDMSPGVVASRGLRRIILSASEKPNEFVEKRCKLIQVTARQGETKRTYDGCAIIAAAGKRERASATSVVVDATGSLRAKQEVESSATMPAPMKESPQLDATQLDAARKRSATVVQSAALACQELASGTAGTPVSCSVTTFNTIGSVVTMAPPPPSPPGTDVPDAKWVSELVRRVEELVAAQGHTTLAIEKLRTDFDALGAMVDGRLDGVEREIAGMSRAQRDMTSVVGKCKKEQDKISDARKRTFEGLGSGPRYDEVCAPAYAQRWVNRTLPEGALLVSVAELCNEQRSVPITITFELGLFATGKSALDDDGKKRLTDVWQLLSSASRATAALPVVVLGHVDPQGFSHGEYGKRQAKLMTDRAESAVALLKTIAGSAQFTTGVGQVPPPASCAVASGQCAIWRTVSLEHPGLFPVFDTANCK